jgi:hypothetical protein
MDPDLLSTDPGLFDTFRSGPLNQVLIFEEKKLGKSLYGYSTIVFFYKKALFFVLGLQERLLNNRRSLQPSSSSNCS